MLKFVIESLLAKPIHHIVCERDIELSGMDLRGAQAVFFDDVRSAAFYSLGLAQKTQEPVLLIVREAYIGNIFTGLTEAWFQQREIYVVAVGGEILNSDLSFLKPCTQAVIKVQTEADYLRAASELPGQRVPTVFLVQDSVPEKPSARKIDLSILIRQMGPGDRLFAYEPVCEGLKEDRVEFISAEDKYGMLSKYMGYILGFERNCFLVTATDSVDLDMNIFNNRYMCSKFKVIFFGKALHASKRHWLETNGIAVLDDPQYNDASCARFMRMEKPTVWNIVQSEV